MRQFILSYPRAFLMPLRLKGRFNLVSRRANSTSTLTSAPQSAILGDLVRFSERYPKSSVVTVNGFVRSVQKFRKVTFARVSDGRTIQPLQVVMTPEQSKGLSTGTAVVITGEVQPSAGSEQMIELHATTIKIAGDHDGATFPIQKKYHTPEYLRKIPHLRMRTPQQSMLLHLRSEMIASITSFFATRRFVQAHTPIITSSDCEGAGEVFMVSPSTSSESDNTAQPFFKSQKYLTVSSQLHLEAYAQAIGDTWTLAPCFRAERSDTARHLSEFYMLEAEMGFVDEMEDVMKLVQDMLCAVTQSIQSSSLSVDILSAANKATNLGVKEGKEGNEGTNSDSCDGAELQARWTGLVSKLAWPRITYADAITHLQTAVFEGKAGFEEAPTYEGGLAVEHERYLASSIGSRSDPLCFLPVFVTDYPRNQKPFYMAPSTDPSKDTVACFDLLVPGLCELAGGSLREHRLDALVENMRQKGILAEAQTSTEGHGLDWYVDLRRYGSIPHGGFGLGFDRLIAYLSGVQSVRDVVSFPRWIGRCDS